MTKFFGIFYFLGLNVNRFILLNEKKKKKKKKFKKKKLKKKLKKK